MRFYASCFTLFGLALCLNLPAQQLLSSPDEKIEVRISPEGDLIFELWYNGQLLLDKVKADLFFQGKSVIKDRSIIGKKSTEKEGTVSPVVPRKQSTIPYSFNQIEFEYTENIKVQFRVYNDGIAYRFSTNQEDSAQINEKYEIHFTEDVTLWSSLTKSFENSYEVPYTRLPLSAFPDSLMTYVPLLATFDSGVNLLLTDNNVLDYPHLFFEKESSLALSGVFPPYPTKTRFEGDRSSVIEKTGDYIARSTTNRHFPWRTIIIAENDADLLVTNLPYLLAEKSVLNNTDWIKPGKVAWEWWNASNLYGIDFEAGFNTETYRHYIDFAAEYGLDYVLLDEGWSQSTEDISQPAPELDLFELIEYGNSKDIGIILWASWVALEKQFHVLRKYGAWGISGIKVDFMNRSDQRMVNFYERVAKEAATHRLFVNFHGAFKPGGLERKFPNVLTYEGVRGLEYSKWSKSVTPRHNLMLPFIRMVTGPMDYTPGAIRNYSEADYHPVFTRPGSIGTRAHQVALYVAFESGLQMLADSPSNYRSSPECAAIMAGIPTTWDETRVLAASFGEYLVVARRKDRSWYVAGLTDKRRNISMDLSFIEQTTGSILQDGPNAHRHAEDFQKSEIVLSNKSGYEVQMAPGGGFVIVFQ